MATLAGRTSQATVGTLVTNVAMRNPAVLAKQITTLDHISRGRLVVGLGTGYYAQEHAWVGVPFPPAKDRVTRLAEAVEILDRLLRGERFRWDGEYFEIDHAPLFPRPLQRPRPPLVVGAFGERSLDVVARHADAWSFAGRPGEPPESALGRFRELGARLDERSIHVGRAPADVGRSYLAGFADEQLFSSTDAFDEATGLLAEAGADEIVFYFMSDAQQEMRPRGNHWIDRGMLEQLIADGRWRVNPPDDASGARPISSIR